MLSPEIFPAPAQAKLTTPHSVLLVEDEDLIREMIVVALEEEGYQVQTVTDGRTALNFLPSNQGTTGQSAPALIILDLMLPEINGLDLCRLWRYQGNITPILIISAKTSESERVLGLEVGADDYLTKPFSMRELSARCRALIRRQGYRNSAPTAVQKFRELSLFPRECRVTVRGQEVNLSPKEFRLLALFMSSPHRVWSREQLIEQVWGLDFLGETKTVDVHIRWLREKIERDPSHPEYIITVRGFGYRLD